MRSDVVISVKNLTKTYRIFGHPGDRIKQALTFGRKQFHKEFTALQDVSFEIKKGDTVGIIGRNGSGKSTLLQLICGILKPTSGSVKVNGRVSALLELGSGFNPEFTGRENVYFQGAVTGFSMAEMEARFSEIAAFADIGEYIDQPVRTYSSGMYVRLAFSVAIHVEPEILVIDEALGVGDAIFTQKCFRFLNDFCKKGTLIVVSHDLQAVKGLCQHVLWLDHGTTQAFGVSKTICEEYLSAMYGDRSRGIAVTDNTEDEDWADQRLPYINATNLRNDLKLFRFDPLAASFGDGGALIVNVQLTGQSGQAFTWIVGGEIVTLSIKIQVNEKLISPIIGFNVKNGIGQALFGDNTFLSYADNPQIAKNSDTLKASFCFRMPRLPIGDYSVTVAIADGNQGSHVFKHWIHDALIFQSRQSSVDGALVGLPMKSITLTVMPKE